MLKCCLSAHDWRRRNAMKNFIARAIVHAYARNHHAFCQKDLRRLLYWAKSQLPGGEYSRIVGSYCGVP